MELVQEAVLEALYKKSEDLKKLGQLKDGTMMELYFWNDLVKHSPDIFRVFPTDQLINLLHGLKKKSGGQFALASTKTIEEVWTPNDDDILDFIRKSRLMDSSKKIGNISWKLKYSEKKSLPKSDVSGAHIFWLTGEGKLYQPTLGYDRHIKLIPNKTPYSLIKFFAENKYPSMPETIAKDIGSKKRTVENQIIILRAQIKDMFGFDTKAVISNDGNGYKLARNIEIYLKP